MFSNIKRAYATVKEAITHEERKKHDAAMKGKATSAHLTEGERQKAFRDRPKRVK